MRLKNFSQDPDNRAKMNRTPIDISYFPGCSLATSARENNQSLLELCRHVGVNLIELEDWNCCGSSSAHRMDAGLSVDLAGRNLSLAPSGRPLLIACPGCILRLRETHLYLKRDEIACHRYEKNWGRPLDAGLEIIHFFELLSTINWVDFFSDKSQSLAAIKFAPYYGCMLAHPPSLRHEKSYHGLMEKMLSSLGASFVPWAYASRCCGTFLSVARPDVVTPMVNKIINGAKQMGAECIVTACAMCHLNLEIRCNLKHPVPILHFSEVLALALGIGEDRDWFSRHLIDPRPLLTAKGLI